jgi:hypothetical protein
VAAAVVVLADEVLDIYAPVLPHIRVGKVEHLPHAELEGEQRPWQEIIAPDPQPLGSSDEFVEGAFPVLARVHGAELAGRVVAASDGLACSSV